MTYSRPSASAYWTLMSPTTPRAVAIAAVWTSRSRDDLRRDLLRREDAGRVAGVDSGRLDVLHHGRDPARRAIAQRVDVELDRTLEEPVDEDHALRPLPEQVGADLRGGIADRHRTSAQHVGRAHEDRVPDVPRRGFDLVRGRGDAPRRGAESEPGQQVPEAPAILGQVDGLRGGPEDRHAVVGERLRQAQRRLAPELGDHPERLLDARRCRARCRA